MLRALSNQVRLRQARREVRAFTPRNPEQRRTRRLVLAMLDAMEILHCRPGMAEPFAQAWEGVEFLRLTLVDAESSRVAKGDPR